MKRIIRRALASVAVSVALAAAGVLTAQVQHGYTIDKRISFKKGQISTSVKGAISNPQEGHAYIVRARKGQTLTARLSSGKKDAGFFVLTPEGMMIEEEMFVCDWSGEIPASGDYRIIVSTQSKGAARYVLQIQIVADI